ncbi:MAG: hypothetical protein HY423_04875 [Candidatus Lambdaproteobacteria bacterium]|nr:hypothetical protein [Candidatus Lambdaproteobacteria bacterium]
MRSTFDELAKELAELKALVASITPVNSALAGHHDSLVRTYLTIRRRFDYAAFVVALYASFEKYVENLVASYARLVASHSQYAALPNRLTRKHITKSAEILAHSRPGEGRYEGVSEIDLVKNLFDCLSGTTPYSLNDVAIKAHDANLQYSEIGGLFSAVGIEQICDRARKADAMLKWFRESQGLTKPPQAGVPVATLQQRIEDLVERRNQVAHRGGSPEDLLGVDDMPDRVKFIEAFAHSLFVMTVTAYLCGKYVEPGAAIRLELREGPIKAGKVVVVDKPQQRLYVTQPIFGLIAGTGVRWGRIIDLKVNDASVSIVEENADVATVGVRIDFKCPKGVKLFVLESEDEVVWSPTTVTAHA